MPKILLLMVYEIQHTIMVLVYNTQNISGIIILSLLSAHTCMHTADICKYKHEGNENLIIPHVVCPHTIRLSCAILEHYVGSVVAVQN